MAYKAALHEDAPILVASIDPPADPATDIAALHEDIVVLLHSYGGPCALIVDVSRLTLTSLLVSQMLYEALLRPRMQHKPVLLQDPRLQTFVVGRGSLLDLAVRAAAQNEYHNVQASLCDTMAGAMTAARIYLRERIPLRGVVKP